MRLCAYHYGLIIIGFELIDLEKNKNAERTFYTPCIYILAGVKVTLTAALPLIRIMMRLNKKCRTTHTTKKL